MSDPFIGEIRMVAFNYAPRNWAFCDGQLLQINQNQALFSLLGTTYGGNGQTTFALPDLRGRSATHVGSGPGLANVQWGEAGGSNSHTLTVAELPAHSHVQPASTAEATTKNPTGNVPASNPDVATYAPAPGNASMAAVGPAGGNQPFSIQNPYLGIYHVIAIFGIFPVRN